VAAETRKNSNLFSIDYESITSILEDSNKNLMSQCDELLKDYSQLPKTLSEKSQTDEAISFAQKLRDIAKEVRTARLADGKPFRDAVGRVKSFFDQLEKPLKEALDDITERLTSSAHSQILETDMTPSPESETLGVDYEGRPVVSGTRPDSNAASFQTGTIELEWSIESFDRSNLDLEQLRGYLTDNAIMAACRKHLADHGANKIAGIRYREVAKT
jgi:hypothetical protein